MSRFDLDWGASRVNELKVLLNTYVYTRTYNARASLHHGTPPTVPPFLPSLPPFLAALTRLSILTPSPTPQIRLRPLLIGQDLPFLHPWLPP